MCMMQVKRNELGEGGTVREKGEKREHIGRRLSLWTGGGGGVVLGMLACVPAVVDAKKSMAEPAPPPPPPLCDEMCIASLDEKDEVKTSSGLRYRDLVVGKGPAPIQGFQVVVNYTGFLASTGQQFTTTIGKAPVDVRAGTGGLIAGLEEGLLSMRAGGIRRLFVPGALAYPKGLPSSPGQVRTPHTLTKRIRAYFLDRDTRMFITSSLAYESRKLIHTNHIYIYIYIHVRTS